MYRKTKVVTTGFLLIALNNCDNQMQWAATSRSSFNKF